MPPLATVNFKDYQEHLAHLKASRWYQRDCAYWQGKLADMPLRPNLPLKVPSATVVHPRFAEHTLYMTNKFGRISNGKRSIIRSHTRRYC